MNLADLAALVLLAAAVLGGVRVGLVARLATWIGLALGVVAATWTVPRVLDVVEATEPGVRLAAGLLTLAITVTVLTSMFQAMGSRIRRSIAASPLSGVDRVAGGIAGALAIAALAWFLLPTAAELPGGISREVRGSAVLGVVETLTPVPPDASRALRALVDSSRFPEVFAELQPPAVTGPPPEAIPVPQAIVDRATAATVNVSADGCGRRYEGSGFAVETDVIVTNAHVIAGSDDVTVTRVDGARLDATPIAYDPERDLALLEVPGLGLQPLPLAPIGVGDEGVSIGYPGGQETPRVAPLRIDERRSALGRDIYGRERTDRQVLFLSADLRQGDSGSPVIDIDGHVSGVVFAISPDDPTTAYALDLQELEEVLAGPRAPDDTGNCI